MIRNLNRYGLVDALDTMRRAPEGCYLTATANAYDAPRAIQTRIDRPPQVMGINEYNMYTEPSLLNYDASGFGYGTYAATNNAEVTYYVDEAIARPFFGPNFGGGCPKVHYENYTDPMGSWKPHYKYAMECPQNFSNLSWINDSTFFREDLMSKQMAVMNQKRAEPLIQSGYIR